MFGRRTLVDVLRRTINSERKRQRRKASKHCLDLIKMLKSQNMPAFDSPSKNTFLGMFGYQGHAKILVID